MDDEYQHFITANKETAKEMIPKKAKCERIKYSDDKIIKQVRRNALHTHATLEILPMRH